MSAIYEKRIKDHFNRFDVDGNGVLTAEDYALAAKQFARSQGYAEGSKESNDIAVSWKEFGSGFMEAFDENKDGKVTPEECVNGFKQIFGPYFDKGIDTKDAPVLDK